MKKVFRNPLFTFVLGILLVVGVITVSARVYESRQIHYEPADSTFKKANGESITTVDAAIDELYDRAKSGVLTKITIRQQLAVVGPSNKTTAAFYFDNSITDYYDHFKIINKTGNSSVDQCIFKAKTVSNSTTETLSEDTVYNTTDYTHMWSELTSKSTTASNDYSRCYYYIECFN